MREFLSSLAHGLARRGAVRPSWRSAGSGLAAVLALTACAPVQDDPALVEAAIDYGLIADLPASPVDFASEVQPVLDARCVVCHGCWDAPCQLKLSSPAGVGRGASPQKVYDGARIRAVEPTRLYVDARSDAEWRARGFRPVVDDAATDPEARLENGVLYRMLRLKETYPQPRRGRLPASFNLELDRRQVCTDAPGFGRFAREHPGWGMPWAMPNLARDEYATLVRWIAQGAPRAAVKLPSPAAAGQIDAWERFLNGPSPLERLMSRYVYEHLFLAHVHFDGTPGDEFYRLVRSRTGPGTPADEIATVLPFDDPGPEPFWYRLVRYQPSIVAKDHLPYSFSSARMARYRELFLDGADPVDELPSYDRRLASNPFKTFAALSVAGRHRFLLDEARFFINGFMKGPVCRGQVALNVIDDHFWVFFFDPDAGLFTNRPEFLEATADYLQMPAERGENVVNLLAVFTDYAKKQREYSAAKERLLADTHATDMEGALAYVWDGDGENPNAALTVFRHYDSASVSHGLAGDYPDTAWIIDYPLFERIHYLLVAGFDVYGNVGHQLNTRLYMDFLRMEGENHFLGFLPVAVRKPIRDEWYQGPRSRRAKMLSQNTDWLTVESVVGYRTDDPQRELFQHLAARLGNMAGPADGINRCAGDGCLAAPAGSRRHAVESALSSLAALQGEALHWLPDVAVLRVDGLDDADAVYSLVLNKGYRNLNSIFADEDQRDPADDTLAVVRGFVGVYPNFYFRVAAADIDAFVRDFAAVTDAADVAAFAERYGLRRTRPDFWAHADWFQARFAEGAGLEGGILDLNRYANL